MKTKLLVLAALLAVVSPAFGWDKVGHSLTGAIAYHDLEVRHPEIIAKMTAILKQASDYSSQLNWSSTIQRSSLPAGARRESLMLFILAARWPDDIKSDGSHRDKSPHDTHPWHYINLPYSIDGSPTFPAKEPNILSATTKLTADWHSATDSEVKANILCFLTHFVGDSHQPLHSSEAFSRQFPKGDAGGGVWTIHSVGGITKLHGFWDDVVIKGDDAAEMASKVDSEAVRIAAAHPRASLPQLTQNTDMKSWVEKETFPLAKRYAYLDGKLPLPKKGEPTTLTEGYKSDAKRIAEIQMALAGYRMSDLLYNLLK